MKTGGGDFSADAYQQLREAYDKEQQRQVDDEVAGTKLMGQEYGLETLPVDSPWKDKIENWQYPSGRGQYLDEHQSPEEILKVMRDAAQERLDAKAEETETEDEADLDNMSDEEFDAHIDQILDDVEVDDSEEEEEVGEADEDDKDEVEEEESEEDVEEEAEESESDDDDAEEDEPEAEDESEEEVNDDPEQDAEDIAAEIASLRAEIEAMSFVTEQPEEEETTEE